MVVAARTDQTGRYNFRLLNVTQATAITPGTPTAVTLQPGNGTSLYKFTATAGERVYFDQTAFNGSVYVRVLDPTGRDLYGAVYAGSLPNFGVQTLGLAGTYTIVVDADVYSDPNISQITLNVQPVVDKSAALTLGTAVTGSIDTAGQSANYTFTLAAAKRVIFDSLTNDGNMVWTLTGPQGVVISSRSFTQSDSYDRGGIEIALPAGAYTLTVQGNGDHLGSFSFNLLDVAAATAITPGTPITACRRPRMTTKLYSFSGTALDRINLTATGVSGDVSWRLIDQNGAELMGPRGLTDNPGTITLPNTGTYILAIEGRIFTGTPITYTLGVTKVTQPAAAGKTSQNFDAAGLPYVLTQYGSGPGAAVVTGGPTGSYLQLTHAANSSENNVADFSTTAAGPYDSVQVDFDFNIADTSNPGLGLAAVLLNTATYGNGGPSTSFGFIPSLANALAVKLSVDTDGNNNQVALTWNGTTITTVAAGFNLGAAAWDHARLLVTRTDGGALVSVILTPHGGTATTVINQVFVGGYTLAASRLALMGLTDSRTADQSVDNVAIATTPAAAATPALTLGTTQSGNILQAGAVEQYAFTLASPITALFDSLTNNGNFGWTLTGPSGTVVNRNFTGVRHDRSRQHPGPQPGRRAIHARRLRQ